jgi:predicted nucleotidyltransferase
MIDRQQILQISQVIANEFQPEKIILFGSYAYGNPQDDSDVDMLLILSYKGNNLQKSWEILNKVQPQFAIDLIVRSHTEVEERLAWNDFFLREIMEKGQVIYESSLSNQLITS